METTTTEKAIVESMNNVEYAYRGHWFDADTMRFFKSKTYGYAARIDNTYYFISSEKSPYGPRTYSVRKMVADQVNYAGTRYAEEISQVSEHKTLKAAEKSLYKLVGW